VAWPVYETESLIYFGVDYKTAWKIKEENIAQLIHYIQHAIDGLSS
jgi:hypothetical protein